MANGSSQALDEPSGHTGPSKQVNIRMPNEILEEITQAAEEHGLSISKEILGRLGNRTSPEQLLMTIMGLVKDGKVEFHNGGLEALVRALKL